VNSLLRDLEFLERTCKNAGKPSASEASEDRLFSLERILVMKEYLQYIGGQWRPGNSARVDENINPANYREVLGIVRTATREDTEEAIASAKKAFPLWKKVTGPKRGQILFQFQRLLERDLEELALILTKEEGKTLKESRGEVQKAINIVEFLAGEGRRWGGLTRPSELANNLAYTIKQARGVVAVITPWNFPVAIPVWKIVPALVTGNTCVFKPASSTPASAFKLVQLLEEAGIPQGVLNLVIGSGSEVGDTLVQHPDVKAVTFTGSNGVGSRLYVDAAKRGIPVQCEMGGKNALILLKDGDLDLAAEATLQGAFGSTGQRCTATSRVIVEESVADEFLKKLTTKMDKIVVGDPLDEKTTMGPSVDRRQFEEVQRYILTGKEQAELVKGGEIVRDLPGFFIQPTLFDRVTPEMIIAQEEIFGPVLSMFRVKNFDEAMSVANNSRYGLTSSLYTNDSSKVFRYIDEIETGMTHINSPTMGGEAHLPFGGMKATGIGHREMNEETLEFYTETKTVYIDYTGQKREGNLY
jgi:acyl-CoA reductase-like NAD-dependent aldehyde dehydrogenase